MLCSGATVTGSLLKWQPINIDVEGPVAGENNVKPNPFLDIRLDIELTSPSGEIQKVPGFFAGDGYGHGDGSIWRVRFTPDEEGLWHYSVGFVQATAIAVASSTESAVTLPANGSTGQFTIAPLDNDAPGFSGKGRLEYVGAHYLKHADGPYWIKGGVDSPENFLGYAGFDNTINQSGGVGEGALQNGVHRYQDHILDWQQGDPNFISSDTGIDGKGIIGAINYLAEQGINSMYFLLMNLGGDGRDTYPFVGATGSTHDNSHYDISKLFQWNIVLNHMQHRGIAGHLVLGEQEEGNTHWLDDGELGVERKLYYRELVARFGYLNALKWNISEESRFGDDRHRAFAQYIRQLDWSQHPIAIHTWADNPEKTYTNLLGSTLFDITSIQFSAENADSFTETWRQLSNDAGWPWVIDMDEVGPGNTGLNSNNTEQMRREVLYPVYFSGGNVEWYFGQQAADIRTESFRTRQAMYQYMRIAREFLQRLPFWEMQPNDSLLVGGHAGDQVFAKSGEAYALYLNSGEAGKSLNVLTGDYLLRWFDPRTGQYIGEPKMVSGKSIELGAAPADQSQDWVIEITKKQSVLVDSLSTDTPFPAPISLQTTPELAAAQSAENELTVTPPSAGTNLSSATAPQQDSAGSGTYLFLLVVGLYFSRRFVLGELVIARD